MAIWDESEYSKTSTISILKDKLLKDKILDNIYNDQLRQQIVAAMEVEMPNFLALCKSFDSFDGKEHELYNAEDAHIGEEKISESFFLPISDIALNAMKV